MASQHILVVEDESKISDVLQDYLNKGGYSVTCLSRGDLVLPQIRRQMPDLILLDIMLPGMDGTEVCREIRKHWNVPIIMITARVEEVDRILGLELGADDYICKPFSPREVVTRVKTVLRRTREEPDEKQIAVGPLLLDPETFQVEVAGRTIRLTGNEFTLLKTLMSRPDRVFSRAELLNRVQGYEYDGYDRTIDSHVKNLRKKIAAALPDQEIIVTVYGIGYKLTSTGSNAV
jgi:two-component system response regulator BaeR